MIFILLKQADSLLPGMALLWHSVTSSCIPTHRPTGACHLIRHFTRASNLEVESDFWDSLSFFFFFFAIDVNIFSVKNLEVKIWRSIMRFRSKIRNFSNPVLCLCLIFIAWSKMPNDLYQKTIYWNLKVNKVLLTHVQGVWERSTAQTDSVVWSKGPGDGWLKYTQYQKVFNQQCDTVRNPLSSIFGANSANLISPRMSETQQWSFFFSLNRSRWQHKITQENDVLNPYVLLI